MIAGAMIGYQVRAGTGGRRLMGCWLLVAKSTMEMRRSLFFILVPAAGS
jgi:hypothetical protein